MPQILIRFVQLVQNHAQEGYCLWPRCNLVYVTPWKVTRGHIMTSCGQYTTYSLTMQWLLGVLGAQARCCGAAHCPRNDVIIAAATARAPPPPSTAARLHAWWAAGRSTLAAPDQSGAHSPRTAAPPVVLCRALPSCAVLWRPISAEPSVSGLQPSLHRRVSRQHVQVSEWRDGPSAGRAVCDGRLCRGTTATTGAGGVSHCDADRDSELRAESAAGLQRPADEEPLRRLQSLTGPWQQPAPGPGVLWHGDGRRKLDRVPEEGYHTRRTTKLRTRLGCVQERIWQLDRRVLVGPAKRTDLIESQGSPVRAPGRPHGSERHRSLRHLQKVSAFAWEERLQAEI